MRLSPTLVLALGAIAVLWTLPMARAEQPATVSFVPCGNDILCDLSTCPGPWYVSVEAIWLKRSVGDSVFLGNNTNFVVAPSGVTTETLTTHDEPLNYRVGPRIILGCCLDDCTRFETSYAGLTHWSASRTILGDPVTGTILLNSPWLTIDDPGIGLDTSLGFRYRAELHNVELNLLHDLAGGDCCRRAALLGGFRYMNLDERFHLTGVNTTPVFALETVGIHTRNNLVGVQVGGELSRRVRDDVTVELRGKAGLYVNFARQGLSRQVTADAGTATNLSGSDTGAALATSLDAGLFARLQLCNHIVLRGGYEVMVLSGLALASQQLQSNIQPELIPNHLHDRGTAIFHGPSVGLEITWGGQAP